MGRALASLASDGGGTTMEVVVVNQRLHLLLLALAVVALLSSLPLRLVVLCARVFFVLSRTYLAGVTSVLLLPLCLLSRFHSVLLISLH